MLQHAVRGVRLFSNTASVLSRTSSSKSATGSFRLEICPSSIIRRSIFCVRLSNHLHCVLICTSAFSASSFGKSVVSKVSEWRISDVMGVLNSCVSPPSSSLWRCAVSSSFAICVSTAVAIVLKSAESSPISSFVFTSERSA